MELLGGTASEIIKNDYVIYGQIPFSIGNLTVDREMINRHNVTIHLIQMLKDVSRICICLTVGLDLLFCRRPQNKLEMCYVSCAYVTN